MHEHDKRQEAKTTRENRAQGGSPDPQALAIARAVQNALPNDTVILFGSRAVGDYHEGSDVDLLVITDIGGQQTASALGRAAALRHMAKRKLQLPVEIIPMDQATFARCRRANQHIAGQAIIYGVPMRSERISYSNQYEDGYPDHWPETQRRLRKAEEFCQTFDEMVERNDWNKDLMGFNAQQAVENAIKGWLSTLQNKDRFQHDLESAWAKVEELEKLTDWSSEGSTEARDATRDLLAFTRYGDPVNEDPALTPNWLTLYAAVYRYGSSSHKFTQEEQESLQEKVDETVSRIMDVIHYNSGTTEWDAWPEGVKPWET